MAFAAYTVIGIWQNNHSCGSAGEANGLCYQVASPLEPGNRRCRPTGACFGFLWWNASPAKIIMRRHRLPRPGQPWPGSLLTRTELLLIVLGGLYVAVTGSVTCSRCPGSS